MKGTVQVRLVLTIIIASVTAIRASEGIVNVVLKQLTNILKLRFKELSAEVKDLTADEIQTEVEFVMSHGFKESVAKKLIGNLVGAKASTIPNLVKDLLKKF